MVSLNAGISVPFEHLDSQGVVDSSDPGLVAAMASKRPSVLAGMDSSPSPSSQSSDIDHCG